MSLASKAFPESTFGLQPANTRIKMKRGKIYFMVVFEIKIIKKKSIASKQTNTGNCYFN
jgi:hypothetical protein